MRAFQAMLAVALVAAGQGAGAATLVDEYRWGNDLGVLYRPFDTGLGQLTSVRFDYEWDFDTIVYIEYIDAREPVGQDEIDIKAVATDRVLLLIGDGRVAFNAQPSETKTARIQYDDPGLSDFGYAQAAFNIRHRDSLVLDTPEALRIYYESSVPRESDYLEGLSSFEYDYRFERNVTTKSTSAPDRFSHLLRITYTYDAVPEPATWAMLIGGFGLTGAALRRRRRRSGLLDIGCAG